MNEETARDFLACNDRSDLSLIGFKPNPIIVDCDCRCQNRRISGRGSRTVRLRRIVTGGREHDVLPRFGPS